MYFTVFYLKYFKCDCSRSYPVLAVERQHQRTGVMSYHKVVDPLLLNRGPPPHVLAGYYLEPERGAICGHVLKSRRWSARPAGTHCQGGKASKLVVIAIWLS